jgi:hypothetical protein
MRTHIEVDPDIGLRGVNHTEARHVALADRVEHAAPHRKASVDAIRVLLGLRIGCLAGDEILEIARREVQVLLVRGKHQSRDLRTVDLLQRG